MRKIFLLLILCGGLFLEGCKNEDPICTKEVPADRLAAVDQVQLTVDLGKIDVYLSSKNLIAQAEPNGTRYIITKQGTGAVPPCLESIVTVKYNLKLLGSGTTIEESASATFRLSGGLILGWQLVLPLIPAGSIVKLYVPSGYAYGSRVSGNNGSIPANANLVFEIELLGVR